MWLKPKKNMLGCCIFAERTHFNKHTVQKRKIKNLHLSSRLHIHISFKTSYPTQLMHHSVWFENSWPSPGFSWCVASDTYKCVFKCILVKYDTLMLSDRTASIFLSALHIISSWQNWLRWDWRDDSLSYSTHCWLLSLLTLLWDSHCLNMNLNSFE